MKKLVIVFLSAIIFICCFLLPATGKKLFQHKFSYTSTNDNTLTSAEKKEGWQLLFDGSSMAGWRTYRNEPANTWLVDDNNLCCKKDTAKTALYADLITDKEFENFELQIDWKISPQCNSGILYLVTEKYEESYESGPEYQLIDDKNYPEKIEDWQKTGANYAMNAPLVDATNPVSEWNHTLIIVNKGHVEHWLNGKKVVEYQLWTDEWKQHKAVSKWKNDDGYAASKTGHIALQGNHGGGLWFKNIKIKLL